MIDLNCNQLCCYLYIYMKYVKNNISLGQGRCIFRKMAFSEWLSSMYNCGNIGPQTNNFLHLVRFSSHGTNLWFKNAIISHKRGDFH